MWAGWALVSQRSSQPQTGLDVIVSTVGKIEALYTFLNSVAK